jgi:tRNA dimethylallyltransferase
MLPYLIVICGATATGKSGLGLEIAKRLNSLIISADSRQVYCGFDIGTAKPSKLEQGIVPHYLIDICDPKDTLTLAQYQGQANPVIERAFNNGILPLLVGGTGLYIKSIVRGLKIPRVSPQNELRSQLTNLGQTQLYCFLRQVDAIAAAKIHPNDRVRTLRALEVYYVTGVPISQQQGESPPNYPILQMGLDCDSDALDQRIEKRTLTMMEMGLVEEVEQLIAKYGEHLPLLDTLGYAEIKQYLRGDVSLDEAIKLTVLHTRQFAKRQKTWFRSDPQIRWFNANHPRLVDQVWMGIREFEKSLP